MCYPSDRVVTPWCVPPSDLGSVLRQDYNTISADSYITIEVKAILLPGISSGIKTVAILEFSIVSVRTAVEAHNPHPRTREPDIKRMKIQCSKVHHDNP